MADDAREIVARAICDSMEADCFDDLHERSIMRAAYLQQADAAIAAMPTALLDEARTVIDGLLGWGRHDEGCRLDPEFGKPGAKRCDCGLAEAEKDARKFIAKLSRPV